MNRIRALLVVAVSLAVLTGCAGIFPLGGGPTTEESEVALEQSLLAEIDIANGVYVSRSDSGGGKAVLQVRLYVDTDEVALIADAVDAAAGTAWLTWPSRPVSITVGVVVGSKPSDVGTADPDIVDLTEAASLAGFPDGLVRVHLVVDAPVLEERYGARE